MSSTVRLSLLYMLTVLGGIAAALVAPALAGRTAQAHAQTTTPHFSYALYQNTELHDPVVWTRPVAIRALKRGDTLNQDDFVLADTLIHGRIPTSSMNEMPQAGWLIRRAIAQGEWLRPPAVSPVSAVSAGNTVFAFWNDGAVNLALSGVALNSAPIGGKVTIRTGRTRRLEAVVIGQDSVRIR